MKKAITEIRGMDTHDLRGKLAELRKEQFDMRFHGAAEQVARPSRHKEIRRTIARIQLVLAERGDSASEPSPKQTAPAQTSVTRQSPEGKTAGGKKR
jgi:large subunit ribosomal protein L29